MLKFRLWLASLLLGKLKHLDDEEAKLYQDIWPKHSDYEKENKTLIREAIRRAYISGRRD